MLLNTVQPVALAALTLLVTLISVSEAANRAHRRISEHPVFLIVSYDGFRYDYMDKTATPNLDRVKASGSYPPYMKNQFLSNTFPNHHTMATGLFIESHGIVGNSFYDTLYGKKLSGYNDDPGFWNYTKEVIPLWTANELAGDNRYSGAMMWCGSNEPWGPTDHNITYRMKYNSTYPYEQRVDDVVSWITNDEKPANLVFLYFSEPDGAGHDFGPNSPEVIEAIQRMDNVTGYLLDKLSAEGILDQINILFLSDHGMSEVKPEAVIPHSEFIDNSNQVIYTREHGTPVLHLLPKDLNKTEEIYQAFKDNAGKYNFSVYLTSDLKKDKPNWHYAAPRRVMPIIAVAQTGWAFDDYWGAIENKTTGNHGYDPEEDKQMYPYFIAMGPMFQKNVSVSAFDNVDIYPLVTRALGIEGFGHKSNGSYQNMLSLLTDEAREAIGAASGVSVSLTVTGFAVFVTAINLLSY